MTTAWTRRIDPDPPRSTLAAKARLLDVPEAIEDAVDETTIADERLELVFTCCHPALALDAQVALTLRTLGGLSTEEIARAFLVPEATMAQAARPREAQGQGRRIPFRLPPALLPSDRRAAVLAPMTLPVVMSSTA